MLSVNDLWRWRVFRGDVPYEEWNEDYWRLKHEIVGVKPPVERTETDLDPPTLYHICQDYDMIRYFTRTILQFQFAEALCEISGHEGPLHRCDFSGRVVDFSKIVVIFLCIKLHYHSPFSFQPFEIVF